MLSQLTQYLTAPKGACNSSHGFSRGMNCLVSVKKIPLIDPALGRSKRLHDAVDSKTKTGWSLKTVQLSTLASGTPVLFIIQRADVIKKANSLGFPGLTEKSQPADIGAAIIKHWNDKLETDRSIQGVTTSYEGVLFKTRKGVEYVYAEYPLNPLDPAAFSWNWTLDKKSGKDGAGLQGSRGGKTALVWYKNQKQLFKVQTIPSQAVRITIARERLTPKQYVKTILAALREKHNSVLPDEEDETAEEYSQLSL